MVPALRDDAAWVGVRSLLYWRWVRLVSGSEDGRAAGSYGRRPAALTLTGRTGLVLCVVYPTR